MVLASNGSTEPPSPGFAPVRMDDVEIGGSLPALPSVGFQSDTAFAGSMCLVRLHGQPLGTIDVTLPSEGLASDALAARIDAELSTKIVRHLRGDGLEPRPLEASGLAGEGIPSCEAERLQFLQRAPHASVVICTRDRPDSVRTTLTSILACRYPSSRYEVVVVDNASEGDSLASVIEAEFQDKVTVRVVREPEPGLSHARNRGLAAASGKIVIFADDDVLVDRDWLLTLTAAFERGDRVGASSGLTLPKVLETPAQRWVEGFGGRIRGFERRTFDIEAPPNDRPLFPFTIGDLGSGRNMAFERETLVELGGFDVALGPGTLAHDGDDVEALLRVLLSGRQIVHDPAAIVWHAHPREYAELEDRVWGYGIGLTACLTKAIVDRPRLLADLLRKLPRGIAFALSAESPKNAGRQDDFPRKLIRRELGGMAYGPIAYARSRAHQRRRRKARLRQTGGRD